MYFMYETYNLIMLQFNAQATFIESIKYLRAEKIKIKQKKRNVRKFYAIYLI